MRAGYLASVDLAKYLREIEAGDQRLLHGDAVGMNMLLTASGPALIDPAGVWGPREFDAARWVVRGLAVAHPSTLDARLEEALCADDTLEEEVLQICAGVELALEAHQRMVNPQMFLTSSGPLGDFDERVALMVSKAQHFLRRLL